MSARKRWNIFRRSFRLDGVGVSRATEELETTRDALTKMEEEERLLEEEVEDLRRRIAEEREGEN